MSSTRNAEHDPIEAAELEARQAEAQADEIERLVLNVFKRRAQGIAATLDDDPEYKLTGPDIAALKEMLKIAAERAQRLREKALLVARVPKDPRLAELGFALATGDLPVCWKLLVELCKDREEAWVELKKYSVTELSAEEMMDLPEDLKEAASKAFPQWTKLDAAAVYSLIQALPEWDWRGRIGCGGDPEFEKQPPREPMSSEEIRSVSDEAAKMLEEEMKRRAAEEEDEE